MLRVQWLQVYNRYNYGSASYFIIVTWFTKLKLNMLFEIQIEPTPSQVIVNYIIIFIVDGFN